MKIKDLIVIINELNQLKCMNSRAYKAVNKIMQYDSTTHNIEAAIKLHKALKEGNEIKPTITGSNRTKTD